MASTTDICIVRFQNALLEPLTIRCQEIARIAEDFSSKELHSIYPILVGDIFGISNQIGWGLRRTFMNYQAHDYCRLLEFFHPEGSFFKLCYKLMTNSFSLKYDFPLSCLPTSVKNMIDDGLVPTFYSDYLKVDPQTGIPASLSLIELFLFHFAHHLVRTGVGQGEPWVELWDTAYLQLAIDYCHYFLRCDGSPVPPVPGYYITRSAHSSIQTPHRTPVRTPTLFRPSVYNTLPGTGSAGTGTAGRMEIWRSELLAQVFVDYWLDTCKSRVNSSVAGVGLSPHYQQLASLEHIRVVRNLLKHLHSLTNSCTADGSTMDEFKRQVLPGCRTKIHGFLRRTIDQWPLDASFRLILETWLSYIQPWRYTNLRSSTERIQAVDRRWITFIADNLLTYTVIYHQVVNRLSRLDLATPKNANMLGRLTKVFAQGNLGEMVFEVESFAVESANHKFGALLQQQCLELEPPGFIYVPMFSQQMLSKMSAFTRLVYDARQRGRAYLQSEELKLQKHPTSLLSRFFNAISWSTGDPGDYSLEDRKRAVMHLEMSLDQLAMIFQVEKMDMTSLGNFDCTLSSDTDISREEQNFHPQDLTPRMMHERRQHIKYEGDPDLQPIRSWESTLLVRLLYQLSSKINEMYATEMSEYYQRTDVMGSLARQVLLGPQVVRHYEQSRRVEGFLHPRLSLRTLASHRLIVYFVGLAVMFYYMAGISPLLFSVLLALLWASLMITRALLETWTRQQ